MTSDGYQRADKTAEAHMINEKGETRKLGGETASTDEP